MTDTLKPPDIVDPSSEPAGRSDILFGAGQAAWLTLVTLVAGLALVLAIAALLKDNGEGGGSAPTTPAGTSVSITASEFAFSPDSARVAADTDVAITLTNEGAVTHNLVILAAGSTVSNEADLATADFAAETDDIEGGASVTETVNLPAGTYQFVCTIAGHFASGMNGTLTVG